MKPTPKSDKNSWIEQMSIENVDFPSNRNGCIWIENLFFDDSIENRKLTLNSIVKCLLYSHALLSPQCLGNISNSNPFRILSMHSYSIWYLAYLIRVHDKRALKRVLQWTNSQCVPTTENFEDKESICQFKWRMIEFKIQILFHFVETLRELCLLRLSISLCSVPIRFISYLW